MNFNKKNLLFVLFVFLSLFLVSCDSQETKDRMIVSNQQEHYATVHPIPQFEFSVPRQVLIQIYGIVTEQAVATYSVAESITGEVRFRCPSIGYAIPVDTQLTNPLQPAYTNGAVIEQAEPNGLFSSKNTDGTWVLCLNSDGQAYPYYSEHKIQVWPFPVVQNENGEWVQVPGSKPAAVINTDEIKKDLAPLVGQ